MSTVRLLQTRRGVSLLLLLTLMLGACAAPPSDPSAEQPAAASSQPAREPASPAIAAAPAGPQTSPPATTPRSKPAPPMSDPLPAQRVPDVKPAPRGAAQPLDVSCRNSADCTVKNVGSCCGLRPKCVNVNATVDPKAVQEQCARNGMVSTCGFKPVEGCECKLGQCSDKLMMVDGQ